MFVLLVDVLRAAPLTGRAAPGKIEVPRRGRGGLGLNQDTLKKLRERIRRGYPKCEVCGIDIPLGRLECIPDTNTCVKHSKEAGYVGVNVFAHKTAPEVQMVKRDQEESVRQLWRAYHRKR